VIGEEFTSSESAVNAINGKHFQYWRFGGGYGSYEGNSLEAVKLNSNGQLALITGVEGKPKFEGELGPRSPPRFSASRRTASTMCSTRLRRRASQPPR
jgi:hypothetical protein